MRRKRVVEIQIVEDNASEFFLVGRQRKGALAICPIDAARLVGHWDETQVVTGLTLLRNEIDAVGTRCAAVIQALKIDEPGGAIKA